MDFQTAVRTCFNRYATFTGRARRPELWWFALFNLLAGAVLAVVDAVLGFEFFSSIYSLLVLLPSLAVGARRLHDIGRSGWWQLLSLIPVIGVLVLIYWYIQPGDPEANEYGPPPPA
ncbi:MAG: DUF805 domain-containing protein [Defluviimonas sp.]|nr:DUF805 domain-containing protein [Defluviimonas sp.]